MHSQVHSRVAMAAAWSRAARDHHDSTHTHTHTDTYTHAPPAVFSYLSLSLSPVDCVFPFVSCSRPQKTVPHHVVPQHGVVQLHGSSIRLTTSSYIFLCVCVCVLFMRLSSAFFSSSMFLRVCVYSCVPARSSVTRFTGRPAAQPIPPSASRSEPDLRLKNVPIIAIYLHVYLSTNASFYNGAFLRSCPPSTTTTAALRHLQNHRNSTVQSFVRSHTHTHTLTPSNM